MIEVALQSDCDQCAALCCVSFSFDKSSQFAIDKSAGVACPNLGAGGGCSIHDGLNARGFNGCVQYDCYGAGQHLTQDVFAGRSWQDDASLLAPMMNGFRAMRLVHELLLLLNEAGKLSLSSAHCQEMSCLIEALHPAQGWTAETLSDFEIGPVPGDVRGFLSSLRAVVQRG